MVAINLLTNSPPLHVVLLFVSKTNDQHLSHISSTIESRLSWILSGAALNLVALRTTSSLLTAYPFGYSSLDTFVIRSIVSSLVSALSQNLIHHRLTVVF